MPTKKDDISRLRTSVEACFGQTVTTSRHFESLSENVRELIGVRLSPTTLKRLWGYLDEPVEPRLHTLDTLSRYAGWQDWSTFCSNIQSGNESGPVGLKYVIVAESLVPGDKVSLTWAPDRLCVARYLGSNKFEVRESRGTRILSGDLFCCNRIIEGAPLYLDHLTRGSVDMGIYVCGRHTGVRFSLLKNLQAEKG